MNLPRLPVAEWVDALVKWLQTYFAPFFALISGIIEPTTRFFERLLTTLPPIYMIILLTLLVWLFSRFRIALFTLLGFLFIVHLGLWSASVETLALVLTSTLLSVIIGIPLGLWAGRSERVKKILFPVLDLMQTMPAFVYLIPAVFFFALGPVPAVIASVIFAMPPTIRMTSLGLRQVAEELKEVAHAFGATSWQRLMKVEIPLAKSTILAGINQTIMLSLSMVVISSMIGAGGLGNKVLNAISRLQVGKGFEAGLAIVIIAIVLDRVTQNMGKVTKKDERHASRLGRWRNWLAGAIGLVLVGLSVLAYNPIGDNDKQVKLTYVNWDSEVASTHVVKKVLEKQGYQVELIETEAGPMWAGVASGSADAHVAAWLPATSKSYADRYKGQYEDLGVNLRDTYLGLVVPKYVSIQSIEDLNANKGRFEGKIIGIEPGSGIMQSTEKALKEYGLDFQLVAGSDKAMTASLDKAYQQKKWIVITGWEPHWKFNKYELKFLKDPKKIYSTGENIHTIARKGLKEEKPEVYRILDRFYWTKKDMGEVMLKIQEGKTPDQAAEEWIREHPEKVKQWTQ
ncbi:ABC transporter permease/substrate binding protein [Thermoflavimicrobium dichotomicum]|uniref:Glycine betaine/proline transport system substrate-binding protein n=1 Tax=Thermoflavimicrobium dichotomicum TaxID=46223 RepID=A0A1I3RVS6_9BACL|nr:ABC transporter permease/substrate binding protein [Thermoflavimicrobium dichotomicum]SFJ49421.1 glycine betaine/proline transport system substrate-binding protein [Thermoflavimicrobium dichotomicum]